MTPLSMIGIVVLLLGALCFVVPIPHHEGHGVKIGDAKIGVRTEHSDKLPTGAGLVLIVGGIAALALGSRDR